MTHRSGFTLIELMVVAALSIIIVLGASSLFFSSIITNTRKEILTTIKQEGDYALGQMEFLLRNAVNLEPNASGQTCTTGMSSIAFRSRDDGVTTLKVVGNQIASSSATKTVYLTSPTAVTLNTATPIFNCQQTGGVGGYVTIRFSLSTQNTDYSTPNTAAETFTTSVNLRSF